MKPMVCFLPTANHSVSLCMEHSKNALKILSSGKRISETEDVVVVRFHSNLKGTEARHYVCLVRTSRAWNRVVEGEKLLSQVHKNSTEFTQRKVSQNYGRNYVLEIHKIIRWYLFCEFLSLPFSDELRALSIVLPISISPLQEYCEEH